MNKTFYLCQQGVPSGGNQDRNEVRKAGTKVHETPCLLIHFQRFDGRKCWGGANRSEALYSLFQVLSIQHKKMYLQKLSRCKMKKRQSCDISCSHIHRWRTTQHVYCTTVPKYNFKEFASFFYFGFMFYLFFLMSETDLRSFRNSKPAGVKIVME